MVAGKDPVPVRWIREEAKEMLWGGLLALVAGGLIGWWLGRSQASNTVNRQWMSALESAVVDEIIDEEQRSTLIRMQDAKRRA